MDSYGEAVPEIRVFHGAFIALVGLVAIAFGAGGGLLAAFACVGSLACLAVTRNGFGGGDWLDYHHHGGFLFIICILLLGICGVCHCDDQNWKVEEVLCQRQGAVLSRVFARYMLDRIQERKNTAQKEYPRPNWMLI